MKKIISMVLWAAALSVIAWSCDDKVRLLSAIQDGEQLGEGAVIQFTMSQNYPNPFNTRTRIEYQTAVSVHLRMKVYTDDWQEVRQLVDREHGPGVFVAQFDGKSSDNEVLSSGEYFYTLEGAGLTLVRKMKLVK